MPAKRGDRKSVTKRPTASKSVAKKPLSRSHSEFDVMDTTDIAAELGMTVGGLRVNLSRSRDRKRDKESLVTDAPPPDGYLGRSPIWKPATVREWKKRREEYGLIPREDGSGQRFTKRPPKVENRKRKKATRAA